MNFQLALTWMALLAFIGLFVLIFYAVIKELKYGKEMQGNKNNKRKDPKTDAIPTSKGKSVKSKADQGGTSIVTQMSDISHSKVEVVNITNCAPNSDLAFMKEEDSGTGDGKKSFTESLSSKQKNLDVKGQARVYFLNQCTKAAQKS